MATAVETIIDTSEVTLELQNIKSIPSENLNYTIHETAEIHLEAYVYTIQAIPHVIAPFSNVTIRKTLKNNFIYCNTKLE